MEQGFLQNSKINELTDFFKNPLQKLCFIEGKTGFFKTPLINAALKNQSEDFLIFKIKCFESTSLDDIFLSIFEDLKRYSQQKKVSFTKIETNSLSQRINKYLTHISLPTIIIADSLQNVFDKKNEKEKEEILRFLSHLNSMNKFKLVLVSSYFPQDINGLIEVNNFALPLKISMEPFSKEMTSKYFENENINNPKETLDRFYEISKGNPTYIYITANIITTLKTSLQSILNEYDSKKLSLEEYLVQKLITFVPENVKKSLYTLSLFNGGLNAKYLEEKKFFTGEQIAYMTEKGILTGEYGYIYLKSFLKKYLQKSIANYEKIRIHTFWRDFYTSMLPIKPNERVILISRNTMRSQIEYHSSFIIEQPSKDNDYNDMSLMSYLNSNLTAWNIKNTNVSDEDEEDIKIQTKKRPKAPKSLEKKSKEKETGLEKYELTKDELALLSLPVDLRQEEELRAKERLYRTFEQQEEEKKQEPKTITELVELAKNLEAEHSFETAATVYLKALELKSDSKYVEYLPLLLEHLAICCKKMNKTSEAIDFYNNLIDLYSQENETEKMNEIRLEIAQIYKETYRTNHARVIYENFIKQKSPVSDKVLVRSYIELAEIEEDTGSTETAVDYYKKAFSLTNNLQQHETIEDCLSQAYFRYALILDDFHQADAALDYYKKCIKTSDKPSVYLSSSYTNVGEILLERGNVNKAVEYYKLALKTDLRQSNFEGIYYICKKLADIYEQTNPSQVLNWLLKSLSAAKRTKEKMYISNAYKDLGSYYKEKGESQKAEKAFLMAQNNDIESE